MPLAQLPEIQLYYEVSGEGPPVLLLHGLGSIAQDWAPQIPALENHFTVYRTDARGHGQSDKPKGPYTMTEMSGDIIAFIEQEIGEPVHLVGYSMGGFMSYQLVVDRPDLVKSLVIINSVPQVVTNSFGDKLQLNLRLLLIRVSLRLLGRLLAPRLFPNPEQVQHRQALIDRIAGNNKRGYHAATCALIRWSVADRVHEIQQPVLLIAADQDYTPVSEKQRFVGMMPNAHLEVIADSTHATPQDQPEALNALLAQFLSEQSQ